MTDPGVWRASAGVNYSEGDYGDTRKTKVVSAPLAIKYSRGGFSVRVSVPFVQIDGPGSLLDTPQGRDAGFGDDPVGFDDHGGSGSQGSGAGSSGSSGSTGSSGSSVSGTDDLLPDDSGSGGSGSGGSGSGGSGSDDGAAVAAAPAILTPAAAAALAPANRRSGIGDMSVTLAYSIGMGGGFYADVSGRVKIPTASRSRRLGTGKVDFTGGIDLVKDIGKASLYVGGRHKLIGKPAGTVLRDVWGFGTGASYRLSRGLVLGADYDWQQSATRSSRPSSEITGWANMGLSRTVRMQVYASTGFSTNSADFAGGLSLSWRFR